MRVLPLALWHRGTDEELVADAHTQSLVTHGHPRSQVCCALYCLWARRVARGEDVKAAWTAASEQLEEIYIRTSPKYLGELGFHVRPLDDIKGRGSGYVVDCLRSARDACFAGDYETTIKTAIALGHDTDTTACVAGGIAGLVAGVDGIPIRWREGLRARELAASPHRQAGGAGRGLNDARASETNRRTSKGRGSPSRRRDGRGGAA